MKLATHILALYSIFLIPSLCFGAYQFNINEYSEFYLTFDSPTELHVGNFVDTRIIQDNIPTIPWEYDFGVYRVQEYDTGQILTSIPLQLLPDKTGFESASYSLGTFNPGDKIGFWFSQNTLQADGSYNREYHTSTWFDSPQDLLQQNGDPIVHTYPAPTPSTPRPNRNLSTGCIINTTPETAQVLISTIQARVTSEGIMGVAPFGLEFNLDSKPIAPSGQPLPGVLSTLALAAAGGWLFKRGFSQKNNH